MASFEEELRKAISTLSKNHDKKLFIIGVLDNDCEDFVTCVHGSADANDMAKSYLAIGAGIARSMKDRSETDCDCEDCMKEKGCVN